MAHEWCNAATGRAAMRNEIATTNDRPYKLVKPKKLPCGRCRLASVLRAGHNTNLGLVVTRRPDASWKRYGDVAVDARGPEICKTWKPLRSTSTHCEGRNAARGIDRAASSCDHVVLDENAAEWRQQSRHRAAHQSNPTPWTRRRLDGADVAARKAAYGNHVNCTPRFAPYGVLMQPVTCAPAARRGGV